MIRPARADEATEIRTLVETAYAHYVPRIGMRPIPMDDDYDSRVSRGEAWVVGDVAIDGVIVLVAHDDHLLVDNVAVRPERQRLGIGRALLAFAEEHAARLGLRELRLYTNVKMVENRALYARLGYEELDEADVRGRHAVQMRKRLDPA